MGQRVRHISNRFADELSSSMLFSIYTMHDFLLDLQPADFCVVVVQFLKYSIVQNREQPIFYIRFLSVMTSCLVEAKIRANRYDYISVRHQQTWKVAYLQKSLRYQSYGWLLKALYIYSLWIWIYIL